MLIFKKFPGWFWCTFLSLCVCTSICVHMHVEAEVNTECRPLFSTLWFETESLTEPRITCSARLGCQQVPRDSPVSGIAGTLLILNCCAYIPKAGLYARCSSRSRTESFSQPLMYISNWSRPTGLWEALSSFMQPWRSNPELCMLGRHAASGTMPYASLLV